MNIPKGYKKKKDRIIPLDWNFIKIDDILEKVGKKVEVSKESNYQQIGIRSHGKGIFHKEAVTGEELGNKTVFWVEKDCFIVNIVFAWEQAIARTTDAEVGMICSHRFPMYRSKNNKVDIDYLVYLFKTPYGKKILELASPGGAGRNKTLGQKEFINSEILIPNSIDEQKRIIKILSTWDLAINKQEQLIEKKKEFKKGLMQRLLSGEVRFKEFTDEWRKLKLGDILYEPVKEKVVNPSEYELITVKLHCNGVEKTGKFPNITENGRPYYFRNPGELLIGRQNFHNGGIAIVPEGIKNNICSNAISSFCAKDSINIDFVYYYLSRRDYYKKVEFLIGGTGQKEISKKEFNNLKISIPNYLEQCKIVDFLKTVDNEIELLKKELEALKLQKKGLMQRLLTGEVRVKV